MWRDRCRKNKYIALQKQLNENRAEIMMLSESSAPIEEKSAELHDLKEKNLQICISLFEATEGYKKLNELKNMKPGKRILKIQDYRERIIGDIRESFLDVMNNWDLPPLSQPACHSAFGSAGGGLSAAAPCRGPHRGSYNPSYRHPSLPRTR